MGKEIEEDEELDEDNLDSDLFEDDLDDEPEGDLEGED